VALVHFASDADPEMQRAKENARATFRFFWREVEWEQLRIVPALDLSAVKVAFTDSGSATSRSAPVEEMWIGDLGFDGSAVRGRLLNAPNWLRTLREGDEVHASPSELSDWMYAIAGRVYGGFTVQVLRARMSQAQRREHDAAWGMEFGDPAKASIVPPECLGPDGSPAPEHPLAAAMLPKLEEFLRGDPEVVRGEDADGLALIHRLALSGNARGLALLLRYGVDVNQRTNAGLTPLSLARRLGWSDLARLLAERGAVA
jgi:uncharacterized protein YegJ (DUF2314 family)